MYKRTEGIVLKNTIFGEADLIVTYLTLDYGLLKVFAKSPRKIKSRFGSSLEPLTYSTISFWGKAATGLPRLIQSDIIKSFFSLRENLTIFLDISEMLRLNLNFLPERETNPSAFNLLLNVLSRLESCRDNVNKLIYLYYSIKFLENVGYSPGLYVCGKCGNKIFSHDKQLMYYNFYFQDGSVICQRCASSSRGGMKLSESALRFYNSLIGWQLANLDRIKVYGGLLEEIGFFINAHIRYILGKNVSYSVNGVAV